MRKIKVFQFDSKHIGRNKILKHKKVFVCNLDLSEKSGKIIFYNKWVLELEKVHIFPVKTKKLAKISSSSQSDSN